MKIVNSLILASSLASFMVEGAQPTQDSGATKNTPTIPSTKTATASIDLNDCKNNARSLGSSLTAKECGDQRFTAMCMSNFDMSLAPSECIKAIPLTVMESLHPINFGVIHKHYDLLPTTPTFVVRHLNFVSDYKDGLDTVKSYYKRIVKDSGTLETLLNDPKIERSTLARIFTTDAVEAINEHSCKGFTSNLVSHMADTAFAKVSGECLGNIESEVFTGMTFSFIRKINPSAFTKITPAQIKALGGLCSALTVDQLSHLGPDPSFQKPDKKATKEERAKIEEENKKIANTHPCLAIDVGKLMVKRQKSAFNKRCGKVIAVNLAMFNGITILVTLPTILIIVSTLML